MNDDLILCKYDKAIELAAIGLAPYIDSLKGIDTYPSLLSVDNEILSKLVAFESARVERIEALNPCVEGSTSGHHTDRLDIYQSALEGLPKLSGCYVFADDNIGKLFFSPYDEVIKSILAARQDALCI